jgi:hypothetical protein
MGNDIKMQQGTSVQTGLQGLGKETAQSELFGEVSGKTSRRENLVDAPPVAIKRKKRQRKTKSEMRRLEGISDIGLEKEGERIYELTSEINDLQETINASPVKRLLPLVQSHGDYSGDITSITVKQYRKYLGKEPPGHVVENGKIRWELFLDQLNTEEHGSKWGTYDQEFKDNVEKLFDDNRKLKELKRELAHLKETKRATKKSIPKIEVISIEGNAPVFPKGETTKAIVTEVNGLELTAKRNPSFYQVEDNNPVTPHIQVRYAEGARRLMKAAARGHQKDIADKRGIKIRVIHPRRSKPIVMRIAPKCEPETSSRVRNEGERIERKMRAIEAGGGIELHPRTRRGHIKLG